MGKEQVQLSLVSHEHQLFGSILQSLGKLLWLDFPWARQLAESFLEADCHSSSVSMDSEGISQHFTLPVDTSASGVAERQALPSYGNSWNSCSLFCAFCVDQFIYIGWFHSPQSSRNVDGLSLLHRSKN
jgi:hypothetical protein